MLTSTPIPDALLRLAELQSNVVSREQALGLGLSEPVIDRLLRSGVWRRQAPGVYVVHSGPPDWHSVAWSGVLLGGEHAMLAEEAAGTLWRLNPPPGRICVLVPHESHPRQRWPWHFRRTRNLPRAFGSPPRTPLPDTVIDLCVLQPHGQAKLLADVLATGRTSPSALLRVLDERTRVPNRRQLEAMLGRVRAGIHSELELRYARDVEQAHGLPLGQRQVREGRYRTDVRYDRLIVELDGRLGHVGSGVFRDMARDNEHLLRGNPTLRYGWSDVTERACEVARQVEQMLQLLGWEGSIHPCNLCSQVIGTDYLP